MQIQFRIQWFRTHWRINHSSGYQRAAYAAQNPTCSRCAEIANVCQKNLGVGVVKLQ